MSCPLNGCRNGCHCATTYILPIATLLLMVVIWLFKFNVPLFYAINRIVYILPLGVWRDLNFVAAPSTFILPVALLVLSVVFNRDKLINVIIVLVAYFVIFEVLKVTVGEARPYTVLPHGSFFIDTYFEEASSKAYRSFPSGHVGLMAVFVFSLMSLFCPKSKVARTLLFLLLIFVGLCRIVTGWHWPLDVLASGFIGYLLVKICFYFNFTRSQI